LALDYGECTVSCPGYFTPGKRAPSHPPVCSVDSHSGKDSFFTAQLCPPPLSLLKKSKPVFNRTPMLITVFTSKLTAVKYQS